MLGAHERIYISAPWAALFRVGLGFHNHGQRSFFVAYLQFTILYQMVLCWNYSTNVFQYTDGLYFYTRFTNVAHINPLGVICDENGKHSSLRSYCLFLCHIAFPVNPKFMFFVSYTWTITWMLIIYKVPTLSIAALSRQDDRFQHLSVSLLNVCHIQFWRIICNG